MMNTGNLEGEVVTYFKILSKISLKKLRTIKKISVMKACNLTGTQIEYFPE
jgi:hypothetical protein